MPTQAASFDHTVRNSQEARTMHMKTNPEHKLQIASQQVACGVLVELWSRPPRPGDADARMRHMQLSAVRHKDCCNVLMRQSGMMPCPVHAQLWQAGRDARLSVLSLQHCVSCRAWVDSMSHSQPPVSLSVTGDVQLNSACSCMPS